MNVTESLLRMTDLTKQNLEILQTINEAFYTKRAHLSTEISGERFTIPSFLSLENKVNHIQDAFDNLVHAAADGRAWMNFDGNSKMIQLAGFEQTPNPIQPIQTKNFYTEETSFFKDMLSPKPYITFDMTSTGDNITKVDVLKIVFYNKDLVTSVWSLAKTKEVTAVVSYKEIRDAIERGGYTKGTDYDEYTVPYDTPVRKRTCGGEYIIQSVDADEIDEVNLMNYLTVTFRDTGADTMNYLTTDGSTREKIQPGCILMSYDGSCQLEIVDLSYQRRQVKLRVLHGSYVNLIGAGLTGPAADYSKLKFYRPNHDLIKDDRLLRVALEEDEYVFISAAPVNPFINTRSVWGDGLLVHTSELLADDGKTSFPEYYRKNVKNIGDTLTELSEIVPGAITRFSKEQYDLFVSSSPVMDYGDNGTLEVVQVNKHLNHAEAVKNIRALYSQKQQMNIEIEEVRNKITGINKELAEISFDDMTGVRGMYTSQLSDLYLRQNDLVSSVRKIMDNISLAANDLSAPVRGAKYRIRGYVDIEKFINDNFKDSGIPFSDVLDSIIGIELRYRYKNPDTPDTNVSVVNDFVFPEWSMNNPPLRQREMRYENGKYELHFTDLNTTEELNTTSNEIKFNQIEIPISQGEIVDLQVRIVWSFGYPFTKNTTQWSEILTVPFPDEFIEDVQVKSIIEENNSDIESNRFEVILQEKGITDHIRDEIKDQDITYFHKPENISSGFYTAERRVIPLRDKLQELDNKIVAVEDIIQGTSAEVLQVSVIVDKTIHTLDSGVDNVIHLMPYADVEPGKIATGAYHKQKDQDPVIVGGSIRLTNTSKHTVNLFSMFPGPYTDAIDEGDNIKSIYEKNIYTEVPIGCTYVVLPNGNRADKNQTADHHQFRYSLSQRYNQWVMFTNTSPYTGGKLHLGQDIRWDYTSYMMGYALNPADGWNSALAGVDNEFLRAIPIINKENMFSIPTVDLMSKRVVMPGESLSIPLSILYRVSSSDKNDNKDYVFGIELRHSLYRDPIYYQIHFVAKYNKTIEDTISSRKASIETLTSYNITAQ